MPGGLGGKRLVKPLYCPNEILTETSRYRTVHTRSKLECVAECGRDANCKSVVFDEKINRCHLGDAKATENCSNTEAASSSTVSFYQEPPPCGYGEEMRPMGMCACAKGFTGVPCKRYLHDCDDIQRHSKSTWKNFAVHWVSPLKASAPFKVFCRRYTSTRTYIMDRRKPEENFTRNWLEYRNGFGNLEEDYWIGLEKMYALTNDRDQELRINVKVLNNSDYVISYFNFRISDETSGYKLSVNVSRMNTSDNCFRTLVNSRFSTFDHDRDGERGVNCAAKRKGGFWFNAKANCSDCNPTGILNQPTTGERQGFEWEGFWTSVIHQAALFKVSMYIINMDRDP
ncbi:hypothetical protein ACOMHN_036190 [Nucella lapillus]